MSHLFAMYKLFVFRRTNIIALKTHEVNYFESIGLIG